MSATTSSTIKAPKIKIKNFASNQDESLQDAPTEEHFILRLPKDVVSQMNTIEQKEHISKTEIFEKYCNVNIKDQSRFGKFQFNKREFNTVMVDLPCITESLKTIDNKQFFKVADISQMMIVKPTSESLSVEKQRDYQHEHGITFPLIDVRKTRFRKRMSKKVIEVVEMQVEKLLQKDFDAEDVRFEVHERKDMDDDVESMDADESQESEAAVEEEDQAEPKDQVDFDLEAAIDEALDNQSEGEESDDESDQEEEEDAQDDQEDDQNEFVAMQKSLKQEIQVLTAKLKEKVEAAEKQVNVIMKERFMQIVNKLQMEIEHKQEQLANVADEMKEAENQ